MDRRVSLPVYNVGRTDVLYPFLNNCRLSEPQNGVKCRRKVFDTHTFYVEELNRVETGLIFCEKVSPALCISVRVFLISTRIVECMYALIRLKKKHCMNTRANYIASQERK